MVRVASSLRNTEIIFAEEAVFKRLHRSSTPLDVAFRNPNFSQKYASVRFAIEP